MLEWLIAGAVGAAAFLPGARDALSDAIAGLTGASTLLPDGTVTIDGKNPADPAALAVGAGVTLDVYALARMIASEAGGQKFIAQQAVGIVAANYAADHGQSISALLLHSTHAGSGYFGKQSQGRYAATSKDASPMQLALADQILAGQIDDPTGGARQWDSPRSYSNPADADATEARRIAAGNTLVILPGVPASTFRFWVPA